MKESGARAGEDDFVDVQQEIGDVVPALEDEEGGIRACGAEAELDGKVGKASEPHARCLPEPVQGSIEEVDGVRLVLVDEAGGLLTEDTLLEVAMEECCRHVKLLGRPPS